LIRGVTISITGPTSDASRLARGDPLTISGTPSRLKRHHLGGAADRYIVVIAIPQGEQHVAVVGDEDADRPILLRAVAAIAQLLDRLAVQRHDRRGDRLRKQRVELGRVSRLKARLEIAPIFLERHRQRRDQMRALRHRNPGDQPVGAFGKCREHNDRRLRIVAEIVPPQPLDHRCDLALEPRHVLVAQIAMAGHTDDQRQAVGQRFHMQGAPASTRRALAMNRRRASYMIARLT
jgi:hypothetical protein